MRFVFKARRSVSPPPHPAPRTPTPLRGSSQPLARLTSTQHTRVCRPAALVSGSVIVTLWPLYKYNVRVHIYFCYGVIKNNPVTGLYLEPSTNRA